MNAPTLKKAELFRGMAIESTVRLPSISWMSVHGRDLANAAEYERVCRICKVDVNPKQLRQRVGGLAVHLKAHTLANGLKVATIHDTLDWLDNSPDSWILDAREYSGITTKSDNDGRVTYAPVARTARITRNASLGDGFVLKHLDADEARLSVYNRIGKEYAPSKGKEIALEYSVMYHGTGGIELLEMQCTVADAERMERLIVDTEGHARANHVLIDGKISGTAVPAFEFIAERMVTDIISAVVSGVNFTLWDLSLRTCASD